MGKEKSDVVSAKVRDANVRRVQNVLKEMSLVVPALSVLLVNPEALVQKDQNEALPAVVNVRLVNATRVIPSRAKITPPCHHLPPHLCPRGLSPKRSRYWV